MLSCMEDGNLFPVISILVVAFVVKIVVYIRCMGICCRTDSPPWDSMID